MACKHFRLLRFPLRTGRALVLVAFLAIAAEATAGIRLEWRTATPVVCVGQDFDVGLYGTSTNTGENESFTGLLIGFAWDQAATPVPPSLPTPPQHLRLLSVSCALDSNLATCRVRFPDPFCLANDAALPVDGDGNLLITAVAGQFVTASSDGTLLATFRFHAQAATPAAKIQVVSRFGRCETTLTDNCGGCCGFEYGDLDIAVDCAAAMEACCLPDRRCAYLTRQSCINQGGTPQGSSTSCTQGSCGRGCRCPADLDGNGRLDGRDLEGFVSCFLGCGANCSCADLNGNGSLDNNDLARFQQALLSAGHCP